MTQNFKKFFFTKAAPFFLIAGLGSQAAASDSGLITTVPAESKSNAERRIIVTLGIHWEGESLRSYNLEAIRNFRRKFDGVNFVHFIDPAYFLKPGVDKSNVKEQISSAVQKGDVIALQVHGWQSVVREAKVVFRDSPTFWGQPLTPKECKFDCGHEVPINIYSVPELRQIIRVGSQTLEDVGFKKPTYFAAGGWLSSSNVQEAAVLEGMVRDYSPVPPSLVYSHLKAYPLFGWINGLWEEILPFSQPFNKKLSGGNLLVMPNTAGSVDYQRSQEIIEIMRTNVNMITDGGKPSPLYFQVSMYQETAITQVKKMESILQQIFALSSSAGVALEFDSTGENASRSLQSWFRSTPENFPL